MRRRKPGEGPAVCSGCDSGGGSCEGWNSEDMLIALAKLRAIMSGVCGGGLEELATEAGGG
jgi:hypothetical protein